MKFRVCISHLKDTFKTVIKNDDHKKPMEFDNPMDVAIYVSELINDSIVDPYTHYVVICDMENEKILN